MRRRTCLDSAPWFARNPHTIRRPCSRRIPSTRRPGVLPCNEHISPCGSEFGNDISINFPNTGYRTSCRQHAWTCRSRGTSHPGSTDRRRARLQPHSPQCPHSAMGCIGLDPLSALRVKKCMGCGGILLAMLVRVVRAVPGTAAFPTMIRTEHVPAGIAASPVLACTWVCRIWCISRRLRRLFDIRGTFSCDEATLGVKREKRLVGLAGQLAATMDRDTVAAARFAAACFGMVRACDCATRVTFLTGIGPAAQITLGHGVKNPGNI